MDMIRYPQYPVLLLSVACESMNRISTESSLKKRPYNLVCLLRDSRSTGVASSSASVKNRSESL